MFEYDDYKRFKEIEKKAASEICGLAAKLSNMFVPDNCKDNAFFLKLPYWGNRLQSAGEKISDPANHELRLSVVVNNFSNNCLDGRIQAALWSLSDCSSVFLEPELYIRGYDGLVEVMDETQDCEYWQLPGEPIFRAAESKDLESMQRFLSEAVYVTKREKSIRSFLNNSKKYSYPF